MTPGFRRAALALSGLSKADRKWILHQLSSDERMPLLGLLRELDRQGIQMSPGEVDALLTPANERAAAIASDKRSAREQLAQMNAGQVTRLLSHEPDWLIAVICDISKWPWIEEFLRALPQDRVGRIHHHIRNQIVYNPAVCDALVASIVDRVKRGDVEPRLALANDELRQTKPRRRWSSPLVR